jgi:hypothetical protein
MRQLIRGVVLAAAALAYLSAEAITIVPIQVGEGKYSVAFKVPHDRSDAFADMFEFVSPIDGFLTVTLDSTFIAGLGTYFFGYQVNANPVVIFDSNLRSDDVTIGPVPIVAGPQHVTVGVAVFPPTPGADIPTDYSGSIAINALAIPEPETWLLMSVGLLALTARRRSSSS